MDGTTTIGVIMDGTAAGTLVGTVGTGGTHGKISDRRVSMSLLTRHAATRSWSRGLKLQRRASVRLENEIDFALNLPCDTSTPFSRSPPELRKHLQIGILISTDLI
jgi:hypothetical protein